MGVGLPLGTGATARECQSFSVFAVFRARAVVQSSKSGHPLPPNLPPPTAPTGRVGWRGSARCRERHPRLGRPHTQRVRVSSAAPFSTSPACRVRALPTRQCRCRSAGQGPAGRDDAPRARVAGGRGDPRPSPHDGRPPQATPRSGVSATQWLPVAAAPPLPPLPRSGAAPRGLESCCARPPG